MKKVLFMLLVMALTVHLTACNSLSDRKDSEDAGNETEDANVEEEEEVELTLWTYPVGSWGNASTVAGLVADFRKAYPNIRISVKCLDYANGDSEVEEAVQNGQAPDLIFEGPERLVANWGDRGLMADLSDLWSEDNAEGIYDSVQSACQHRNGQYYQFPVCMTTHCMAINYDMFEAAGALQYIDVENHTWTTDGFIKAVQALSDYGQQNVGAVYCNNQGGDQGTRALVNNLYGGAFTNEDHTRYMVNSQENIKALQLLYDLEGIHYDPELAGGDEVTLFCDGKLAMAFCWNVSVEVMQTVANGKQNFDIFPMAFPTDSGKPKLQGGIWGFGVFDNGDEAKVEAAKLFIKYMTDDNGRYAKAVRIASYWPVRDIGDLYANDEFMSEYGIFTQYMSDYYQITPGWSEARTAWWNMLQEIGAGADIPSAVENFDTIANAAADKP